MGDFSCPNPQNNKFALSLLILEYVQTVSLTTFSNQEKFDKELFLFIPKNIANHVKFEKMLGPLWREVRKTLFFETLC